MYRRNYKASTSGLTPNQMRESIHTTPGEVEGLIPMGEGVPTNGQTVQESTRARYAPVAKGELSNRLKDAHRLGEKVVGIEHDGEEYAVTCVEVEGGVDGLKQEVERAYRARGAATVLGVEQDGKRYRVSILPIRRTIQAQKGRGRVRKTRKAHASRLKKSK